MTRKTVSIDATQPPWFGDVRKKGQAQVNADLFMLVNCCKVKKLWVHNKRKHEPEPCINDLSNPQNQWSLMGSD